MYILFLIVQFLKTDAVHAAIFNLISSIQIFLDYYIVERRVYNSQTTVDPFVEEIQGYDCSPFVEYSMPKVVETPEVVRVEAELVPLDESTNSFVDSLLSEFGAHEHPADDYVTINDYQFLDDYIMEEEPVVEDENTRTLQAKVIGMEEGYVHVQTNTGRQWIHLGEEQSNHLSKHDWLNLEFSVDTEGQLNLLHYTVLDTNVSSDYIIPDEEKDLFYYNEAVGL